MGWNWHSFVCWKRISFIAKDAKDGKDTKDAKDVEDASVAKRLGAPSLNFRPLNYVGPLQGGTDESSKENIEKKWGERLADMNECEGVYIPTRERLLI